MFVIYNTFINNFFWFTDTLNKLLKTVLKIKFDVESIDEKIDRLERSIFQIKDIQIEDEIEDDFLGILPIKNEYQLNDIENKLINKTFKTNLVRY